jgi:hypothetical protein
MTSTKINTHQYMGRNRFNSNHLEATKFMVAVTAKFKLLYVFVILELDHGAFCIAM